MFQLKDTGANNKMYEAEHLTVRDFLRLANVQLASIGDGVNNVYKDLPEEKKGEINQLRTILEEVFGGNQEQVTNVISQMVTHLRNEASTHGIELNYAEVPEDYVYIHQRKLQLNMQTKTQEPAPVADESATDLTEAETVVSE